MPLCKLPRQLLLGPLDRLLFDDAQPPTIQRRLQRFIAGCLFGLLLAQLFWSNVLTHLNLRARHARRLHRGILVLLTVGYPLSRRVRCCTLLTCLDFAGRAGRSYLRAIIIGLLIAGPLANLADNGRDVVRVFGCSARLTYNLTRTRVQLLTAPFRRSLRNLPANVTQINQAFQSIAYAVQPLRDELFERPPPWDDGFAASNNSQHTARRETTDIVAEYRRKIRRRCDEQIVRAQRRCAEAFGTAYRRCLGSLPAVVGHILCAPMRVHLVCSVGAHLIGGRLLQRCEPDASVINDTQLSGDYAQLSRVLLGLRSVRVRVAHNAEDAEWLAVRRATEHTGRQVGAAFERRWRLLRWYMWLVRRLLALFFLRVVFAAVRYHWRYMHDIRFDNRHGGGRYFRHIDQRRGQLGRRPTLWPPRRIDGDVLRRASGGQFWSTVARLCGVLLELLCSVCLVLVDALVTAGLDVVRRHATVDFRQSGQHMVAVHVNGTGVVAQLLRHSVATFNMNAHVRVLADNRRCLPHVYRLPVERLAMIYALYAALAGLVLADRWVSGWRHSVAAYFYFAREKRRVLWLYNECLKRRRGLMAALRADVAERLRRTGRLDESGPMRVCWWLRWCPGCRRKCAVCREPEGWRQSSVRCDECGMCWTYYCAECWLDLDGVCLVCSVLAERRLGVVAAVGAECGRRRVHGDGARWSDDESD